MSRFEGAKGKAERGIRGIIGIFFFHYAGSKRTPAQRPLSAHCRKNRNLLILHWLFHCGKIRKKLRLFLRGYPRASSFSLAGLRLSWRPA